jgi:hypothetical protein
MGFNHTHGSEDVFHTGVNNGYVFLRGAFTRLNVPDPATVFKAPLDFYNVKFEAAKQTDRMSSAPAELKAARKALSDAWTDYGEQYLFHNPLLTIADKKALDIHIDKEREKVPRPTTIPIIVVILSVIRQITFRCYTKPGAKRSGKPDRVAYFVVYWAILDHEPTDYSELIHRSSTSGLTIDLSFTDKDRGKRLYYVGCWAIARDNIEGPLTGIEYVSIP